MANPVVTLAAAIDAYGNATNVSTRTLTLTEAVPAGDMLVLLLFAGSNTAGSVLVTDSKSNTWSQSDQYSISSSGVPIESAVRVTNALAIGDTVTFTFKTNVGGTGATVSENRIVSMLAHVTLPNPSGALLEPGSVAGQAPAASGTASIPDSVLSTPTQTVIWFLGVRVAIVTGDSADHDKITSIPSGWTELGRADAYTTTGIDVSFVWKVSAVAPTSADAFVLDDATHTWRTMIAGWRVHPSIDRALADTAASMSDSLVSSRARVRALADTAASITESIGAARKRGLADTAATVSDSLAASRSRRRGLADTAASISDSLAAGHSRARALSTTAASISDTVDVALIPFVEPPAPGGVGGAGGGGYVPDAWRGLESRTPALRYIELADRITTMSDTLDRRVRRADPEPLELAAVLDLAGVL